MGSTSLRDFVSQVREARRIRFGDLRRLQRDILPARLTSREEAELLLSLEGAVHRTDPDWNDYLVRTVADFVVWGDAPAGVVDEDKAAWLAAALSKAGHSKSTRQIAREIAREAGEADEILLALAGSHPRRSAGEPMPEVPAGVLTGPVELPTLAAAD